MIRSDSSLFAQFPPRDNASDTSRFDFITPTHSALSTPSRVVYPRLAPQEAASRSKALGIVSSHDEDIIQSLNKLSEWSAEREWDKWMTEERALQSEVNELTRRVKMCHLLLSMTEERCEATEKDTESLRIKLEEHRLVDRRAEEKFEEFMEEQNRKVEEEELRELDREREFQDQVYELQEQIQAQAELCSDWEREKLTLDSERGKLKALEALLSEEREKSRTLRQSLKDDLLKSKEELTRQRKYYEAETRQLPRLIQQRMSEVQKEVHTNYLQVGRELREQLNRERLTTGRLQAEYDDIRESSLHDQRHSRRGCLPSTADAMQKIVMKNLLRQYYSTLKNFHLRRKREKSVAMLTSELEELRSSFQQKWQLNAKAL